MSKHTPGPWRVVGEADPEIHGPDDIWITNQVCSGAGDENDDGMANARLIAAAPDLLASLREITSAQSLGFIRRRNEISAPVLARAEAAIALAEKGGSS